MAELSACHLGDIDRAKKLITLAHECGVYAIKLQKRNPVECIPKEIQNKPHPNEIFSYGKTYLEHRQKLELSIEQHAELKLFCEQLGVVYSTSVWDLTSAQEVVALKPEFIKIGSPSNNNFEMLQYLLCQYDGAVHISTGMSSQDEIKEILTHIKENCLDFNRIILYHCTAEYPCPHERLYLQNILTLKEMAQKIWKTTPLLGFSNHGYGISCDVAAFVLGIQWLERHFVDDRTMKHSDASASLEPAGLSKLVRDLKNVRLAMRHKTQMSEEELLQRHKLKGRKNEYSPHI